MGMGDEMGERMVVEGVSEEEAKNGFWRVEQRGVVRDELEDEVFDLEKGQLGCCDEVEGWGGDEKGEM